MEVHSEWQVLRFGCDAVWHPLSSQTSVFACVQRMLPHFLSATNCTVFA